MPIVKLNRGELEVQVEMLEYLHQRVFDPILGSSTASQSAKGGARLTAYRLEEFRDKPDGASKIHHFFWSAVSGTEKSIRFFDILKTEKLPSFEAELEEFRRRWENDWDRRRRLK
jgi:hypothetical protein